MRIARLAVLCSTWLLAATPAGAAPTPEAKCQAAKNKAAGDYADCRQTAEAKLAQSGDAAKYAAAIGRCSSAVASAFAKAEAAAERRGGACPTAGDAAAAEAWVAAHSAAVAGALGPGGAFPGCGDGAVNAIGEQCDLADLGGTTCADLAYSDGALACTPACRFDASSCTDCGPQGGVSAAGTCWFLAEASQITCDAVCSSKGRICNETATRDHAGSGGTLANCAALGAALYPVLLPHTEEDQDNSFCGSADLGVGCGVFHDPGDVVFALRAVAPATTCAADGAGGTCVSTVRRICACD